ncbi:MAG: TylF/MycF/NovP-related O-methyltransferase [Blastocatellia bacterium]|nr:TylF/MycF/NovP-related O-methyltransferase [Blastocatellia bacterium]
MIDLTTCRIAFTFPERLTPHTFWQEHLPFGMVLVRLLRPRVVVELGTHYGDSYCAFCQAIQAERIDARCYAVDNWQGDIHYGEYGGEVLADLRAHHDSRYASFSSLVQSDFNTACRQFGEGSIDLLHIDGTHTYEAVRSDFETWLPKMSDRGVILLHDTNVVQENFGVKKFFAEVAARYPHFEFLHGYGLGVLGVGPQVPEAIRPLFHFSPEETLAFRELFATLGGALTQRIQYEKESSALTAQAASLSRENGALAAQVEETQRAAQTQTQAIRGEWQRSEAESRRAIEELQRTLRQSQQQVDLIVGSRGWRLLQGAWRLKRALTGRGDANRPAPPASHSPTINLEQGYIDLMLRALTGTVHENFTEQRNDGRDWPSDGYTMIGLKRMENLRMCVEQALREGVPGDLVETGVWKGGATIFMRAILKAYGDTSRRVWVADSFAGLPPPDAERYPADAGDTHHEYAAQLAISLEQVQANFARFDLLDEQVRFLKGWFRDTLPTAPIDQIAVLRLDGDMYESTMDGLVHLYPKLSPGGFLIVDDYGYIESCRQAVSDYRDRHGITDEILPIDWTGVYWRRAR